LVNCLVLPILFAVFAAPAAHAQAPTAAPGASITVGSVVNGTSGGLLVGPPEVVRARALARLAEAGLPTVAPVTEKGGTIDAGDARFVVNGLVTGQACQRVSGWTGCRWRIRWDIYDRRTRAIVWRATGIGESSVAQSMATDGMYHDIVIDALDVVAGDTSLARRLAESDPSSTPAAPQWDEVLRIRLCKAAPTKVTDLTGAFVRLTGDPAGTATVISPDGFALTAARLVPDGSDVQVVRADGSAATARVVRVDDVADVALLAIPGKDQACVPPSRAVAQVGDAAISVVATEQGLATAAGGLTDETTISGLRVLDATAAPYAAGLGGAVLDTESHLLGIRVRPLDADADRVLPGSAVPARLGIGAGEASPTDLSTVRRVPLNQAVRLGPVETEEPALLPPRAPANNAVGFRDVPGSTETAIGGVMFGVGGSVAVIAGLAWVAEESSGSIRPSSRTAYAATTITSALVATGGAGLIMVGLRKAEDADVTKVVVGPGSIGVVGRF
jgi:S1-C subfamily serine protease